MKFEGERTRGKKNRGKDFSRACIVQKLHYDENP